MDKAASKILYLVQLPPPVHGVSTINFIAYGSEIINSGMKKILVEIKFSSELRSLRRFNLRKLLLWISLARKLQKILKKEKPDFAYFSIMLVGKGFWRDLLFVRILKKSGIRIVYHIHNRGIAQQSGSLMRRNLFRYVLGNAVVIHLSEELVSGELEPLSLQNSSLVAVPNGVPDQFQSHSGDADGIIHLLFLSNLFPAKGIYDLLEIMSLIRNERKDIRLKIAGVFLRNKYRKILEMKMESLELTELVTLVTPVNPKMKEQELDRADIFLFPSYFKQECFPLVILEAMMHELPIITSNIGAIPEMITNGKEGLLVEARNISEFANAVITLADNKQLRHKLGKAAREKYLNHYTEEHLENNIRKAFEEHLFEKG